MGGKPWGASNSGCSCSLIAQQTIQFSLPVAPNAVRDAWGHHYQMEYAIPAIRRALTITVGNTSHFEDGKLQSCLGSYAIAVSLAAVEREH
jgi:hypothetical protein